MESFRRVLSVLKRMLIGIVAVSFFPTTVVGVINEVRPETLAEHHNLDGLESWLFALVGPVFLAWAIEDIVRPRVKVETWFLPPHNETFEFCSTHPSYVLVDVLVIGWALFLVWVGVSTNVAMPIFWITLGTAVTIPVLRLFFWFVLGWQIDDSEASEAHKPALIAFGIFGLIFGGVAVASWVS